MTVRPVACLGLPIIASIAQLLLISTIADCAPYGSNPLISSVKSHQATIPGRTRRLSDYTDYASPAADNTDYASPVADYADYASPASDSSCPSATQTSCISLAVSDPPASSDPIVQVAADLAGTVYSNTSQIEDYARNVLGASDVRTIQDSSTDTQGVVAVGDQGIMVAFKGTDEGQDWDTNLKADLTTVTFGNVGSGGVHNGFATAAKSVYAQVIMADGMLHCAREIGHRGRTHRNRMHILSKRISMENRL